MGQPQVTKRVAGSGSGSGYHVLSLLSAPSDYSAVSQEVVFPAGSTQRSVAIPIMDDSVLEAMESFYVRVTIPASHVEVVMLDTDVATISITDDDSK